MTHQHSIARRITVALTCLIMLAVTLAALLAFYVYREMQEGMIDKLIQTESSRLVSRMSRGGDQWQGAFERDMGPSMFAWGESPTKLAATLPTELRDLPLGLHELPRSDSHWRVVIAPAMDGRLYVVYDSIMLEQQSRAFAGALLAIVLMCSLLALLVSNAVARWLVTPLNTLTDRLTRWAPGAPVLDVPHTNEADRLLEIFNRVQDQVDAAIADQREFSANLHHEIRTPLTVIQGDAETLMRTGTGAGTGGADTARPRLRRIVRSVQDIRQSLESTYSLAQARTGEPEHIALQACVQDTLETLRLEADQAGLVFVNQVDVLHEDTISRHALMTVMRNIVRNALVHAAPARLEIASVEHGLSFTDSGPGIPPDELPHIFDRYFSNRRTDQRGTTPTGAERHSLDQTGLGLAIAKRVSGIQGWRLAVDSPLGPTGGTRFTLSFRAEADA